MHVVLSLDLVQSTTLGLFYQTCFLSVITVSNLALAVHSNVTGSLHEISGEKEVFLVDDGCTAHLNAASVIHHL